MPRTFGESFSKGSNSQYGTGQYIQKLPPILTAKFKNFGAGFDVSDSAKDVNINTSPWSSNTLIDRRDRIARVPGTSTVETYLNQTLASITLHQSSFNFSYTAPLQFTATGKDTNNQNMTLLFLVWSVDIGTIDQTGLWTPPNPDYGDPGPGLRPVISATQSSITGHITLGFAG